MKFDVTPVLSSLIAGELARVRHISALDPIFEELRVQTEIGGGDLGTDSLDLLALAGAVAEMFHLDETGVEEYLLRYRTVENWSEIVTTSLAHKAERITFRSSGSTGTPKRCVHRFEHLVSEARQHATGLRQCRRVLTMVPSHHIYGFIWTVLLPAELQIPVVKAARWSPARLTRELQAGDLLVGVPAQWQLFSREFDLVSARVFGVTSGAKCPEALFEEACKKMDFLEVYGSSETAGIGTRSDCGEPFRLLPCWQRQAENVLRRTGGADPSQDGVQAPDELSWVTAQTFHVGRRSDGAIQVNGRNVYPDRVAELIRTHPDVRECCVRPLLESRESRLKAFVVWRTDAGDRSEHSLRQWLQHTLQPWEVPAKLTFGDVLPVNGMQKLADWATD